MKPDWSTAPKWATYLAQDADGQWFWYEKKPTKPKGNTAWCAGYSHYEVAATKNSDWKKTLEQRPQ